MLATLLSLVALSLNVGDVRTIPVGMKVYQPGADNWKRPDKLLKIDGVTTGAVIRFAPDGVGEAVEVALLDGTSRFGWLEPSPPGTTFTPRPLAAVPELPLYPSLVSSPDKPYSPRVKRRRYPRQDWSAIDAQIWGMMGSTGGGGMPGGYGMIGSNGGVRDQYVRGYTNSHGTYVAPYYRSRPSR